MWVKQEYKWKVAYKIEHVTFRLSRVIEEAGLFVLFVFIGHVLSRLVSTLFLLIHTQI